MSCRDRALTELSDADVCLAHKADAEAVLRVGRAQVYATLTAADMLAKISATLDKVYGAMR